MQDLEKELRWETSDDSLPPKEKKRLIQNITETLADITGTLETCIKNASLDKLSGPITANLDEVMLSHNIEPCAYHSRSLIGNHCHKYLKDNVTSDICESVPQKTYEMTTDEDICRSSRQISSTFKKLNLLFKNVHKAVSHSKNIPLNEIDTINENIQKYTSYYRQKFPGKVTPKQHILECHVVPWIQAQGVGCGVHSEQGREGLHSVFNQLKRTHSHMRSTVQQLEAMMKEHHTSNSPQMKEYHIKPKRRKLDLC